MMTMATKNPLGLMGIAFTEFVGPRPDTLHTLFTGFGFSRTHVHNELDVDAYQQNDILFLLNQQEDCHAEAFAAAHGPSIASMGWRVADATKAFNKAVAFGARPFRGQGSLPGVQAIYGIGDSLIYFVEEANDQLLGRRFKAHPAPVNVPQKGFLTLDHLTNNVPKGGLEAWARFYKEVFGFTEVRTFDIRGEQTGLCSYALRSPCGSFCIPINEGTEEASQIEEYLREYRGAGIQHLAFLTDDLLGSLDALEDSGIDTLDIDDDYYETVFHRVPGVVEDHARIKAHQVLVDGDDDGYLLQVFTKNLVGPIFIEMIQRRNHNSFGEGNFGALFRSIERDQEKRGTLPAAPA